MGASRVRVPPRAVCALAIAPASSPPIRYRARPCASPGLYASELAPVLRRDAKNKRQTCNVRRLVEELRRTICSRGERARGGPDVSTERNDGVISAVAAQLATSGFSLHDACDEEMRQSARPARGRARMLYTRMMVHLGVDHRIPRRQTRFRNWSTSCWRRGRGRGRRNKVASRPLGARGGDPGVISGLIEFRAGLQATGPRRARPCAHVDGSVSAASVDGAIESVVLRAPRQRRRQSGAAGRVRVRAFADVFPPKAREHLRLLRSGAASGRICARRAQRHFANMADAARDQRETTLAGRGDAMMRRGCGRRRPRAVLGKGNRRAEGQVARPRTRRSNA